MLYYEGKELETQEYRHLNVWSQYYETGRQQNRSIYVQVYTVRLYVACHIVTIDTTAASNIRALSALIGMEFQN